MAWNFKDLTGQRFGRLVVQHLLPKEQRPDPRKTYWVCLCDCGSTFTAVAGDLQQGRINSCKCLRNTLQKMTDEERLAHRRAQRNKFMRRYAAKRRAVNPLPPQALRFTPEQMAERRETYSESQRRWRDQNDQRKRCWRHGVTLEQYLAVLERQGGGCAICGDPGSEKRRLSIDHDHSHCPSWRGCLKCFRGILCDRCNHGLGGFRDNPEFISAALDYLTKWKAELA